MDGGHRRRSAAARRRAAAHQQVRAHRRGRRRAVDAVLAARAPRPLAVRVGRGGSARVAARRPGVCATADRERRHPPPAPHRPGCPSRGVPRRLPRAAARRAAADRARARAAPAHPAVGSRGAARAAGGRAVHARRRRERADRARRARRMGRRPARGGARLRASRATPTRSASAWRFPRRRRPGRTRCATGSARPSWATASSCARSAAGLRLDGARDGGQLRRRGVRRQPGRGVGPGGRRRVRGRPALRLRARPRRGDPAVARAIRPRRAHALGSRPELRGPRRARRDRRRARTRTSCAPTCAGTRRGFSTTCATGAR